MRIIRFDGEVARPISQYGSVGLTLAPLAVGAGDLHIVCMRLAPHGSIGAHPASGQQLFAVTQGAGWAQGGAQGRLAPTRQPIAEGYAALWEAGEWHAVGTESGLTALVIEGPTLTPVHLSDDAPAPTAPQVG